MELTSGRRGGRGSEKAGQRDCVMAMDAYSSETASKLAKHFEEMSAKSHNYPDAQKKYKELAEYNRKKAEGKDELENEFNEFESEAGKNAYDDLAKSVSEQKIRQKIRDGDWEISVDLDPAIRDRRAIEVTNRNTDKKFWVRVEGRARDEYRDEQFENEELARGKEEDRNAPLIERHGRWGSRASDKAGGRDIAMDPLTSKGEEIKSAMQKQYGPEKGEQVFYASANKGTIKGVHE
jgi:hypothetical protein